MFSKIKKYFIYIFTFISILFILLNLEDIINFGTTPIKSGLIKNKIKNKVKLKNSHLKNYKKNNNTSLQ